MKKFLKYLLIIPLIIIAYMPAEASAAGLCALIASPTDTDVSNCCSKVTSSGLCIGDSYNVYANASGDSCLTTTEIKGKITAAYSKNRRYDCGINTTPCDTGKVDCGVSTAICITPPVNDCASKNRVANCDGTCGGCKTNFTACDGDVAINPNYSCDANSYCALPGKTTLDVCTGTCSDCQEGFFPAPDGSCLDHPFYYDSSASTFKGWTGSLWELIGGADAGQVVQDIIDNINNYLDELKAALATKFVGVTPLAAYTGSQSGYKLANDNCSTHDFGGDIGTGSHICNSSDIIHSYEAAVPAIIAQTGIAWFNTGSPSNFVPLVSDCKGWKDGTASYFGNVWNFDIDAGGVQGCNSQKAFACCK